MWTTEALRNESDIEQKLIAPLIMDDKGLAFPASEVYTKQYIAERLIGKRKSKRGYIPDYLVYSHGLPSLVIEVKGPGEDLTDAMREACSYALEINRQFGTEHNPISHVIVSNGHEITWAKWDDASSCVTVDTTTLLEGSASLQSLCEAVGCETISRISLEVRRQLFPSTWWNPVRLAGGTPIQNRTRRWNKFATQLQPLIARFLAKDAPRDDTHIIERCYVTSSDRTGYERTLESLLRDSAYLRLHPETTRVDTSPQNAHNVRRQFAPLATEADRTTTLLIGGVGSGKSLFLDHFAHYHTGLSSNTLWLLIDFNNSPPDVAALNSWIRSEFVRECRRAASVLGEDPDTLAFLKKIFGRQISKKRHILMGGTGPGGMDENEFDKWIRAQIASWVDDTNALVDAYVNHYKGERGLTLVLVFDNADKRTSEDQLAVFQHALSFANTTNCPSIIAMRDETFDIYARQPPLDAVSKHRLFRIEPPRLVDVVSRRIDLVIEFLESSLPKSLHYSLSGGAMVEYSRDELRDFVRKVFNDVFGTNRRVREMVEAVAGKDIRRALEMFNAVLISPYLSEDYVGLSGKFVGKPIPEKAVLRALMRGRYTYYSDMRGESYIHNIYQVRDDRSTMSNYVIPEILAILIRLRKRTGDLGVEGYIQVGRLLLAPELMGYARDDLLWAVQYCAEQGLLVSENVGGKQVANESHVKITSSGFFHLRVLNEREEYMQNVAMSTWMRDQSAASDVADSLQTMREWEGDSAHQCSRRFKRFASYLRDEAVRHREAASCDQDRLVGVNIVEHAIETIEEYHRRQEEMRRRQSRGTY
ncbi:MAG: hypothetical protein KIT19_04195 [Phycisphaeraceae bacterium]|nr:hypothetical protein [Phycisphaeraceae bacterium]